MKTRALLSGAAAALAAAAASGWHGTRFGGVGNILDRYLTKAVRAETGSTNYRTGPGWSVAQVKRMAKKARNRAKHRAASRRTA